MGGIVTYFDPSKKGFITANDFRKADIHKSMDHLEEDDIQNILDSARGNEKLAIQEKKIDYQAFVKMFMPVTDKRFTTLIIQRSEKASKDPPALTVGTQQLAIQLVKSTAIYKKYRSVLDRHRATSPSLSPIGASPDLI